MWCDAGERTVFFFLAVTDTVAALATAVEQKQQPAVVAALSV